MLSQPHNRISERALTVWRITGVIITLFLLFSFRWRHDADCSF